MLVVFFMCAMHVRKGNKYSVCAPTPQMLDLRVGQLLPELKQHAFKVVYAYNPQ
jgi:hypothetical protein